MNRLDERLPGYLSKLEAAYPDKMPLVYKLLETGLINQSIDIQAERLVKMPMEKLQYFVRLEEKVNRMCENMVQEEKWFRVGYGWINTYVLYKVENPNGRWKWHGWEYTSPRYHVDIYPGDRIELKDGKPVVTGSRFDSFSHNIGTREQANKLFKMVLPWVKIFWYWDPKFDEQALEILADYWPDDGKKYKYTELRDMLEEYSKTLE